MLIQKRLEGIYNFIESYAGENGYPPSVREICAAVGLKSPSTVHAHLRKLEKAGLIAVDCNKTRAIRLIKDKEGGIPILGKVTAGQPVFAYEQDLGRLYFTPSAEGDFFALEVSGESMLNAGILDGDYVVARKQQTAAHGEIVVALLEDEATVKRLWRKDGEIRLMPENPDYKPIDGSDCSILGRVVAVVREL